MNNEKNSGFKIGDKVRWRTGSHVYEILDISINIRGRWVAQIDPEHLDHWADLADLVKVK